MIRDYIKTLSNHQSETRILIGEVTAIDTKKRVCDVQPHNGDAVILDVRLQVIEGNTNGFFVLPKKGSEVAVIMFDDYLGCVVQTSEIDSVEILIQGKSLMLDKKGVSIKSASANLKDLMDDIISEADDLYTILLDPTTFLTGAGLPVVINPVAAPKLAQKKAKAALLKQQLSTFLTK
jgi:hypothetical protein